MRWWWPRMGSWLASASNDGTVRVWDPATGAALTSLRVARRLAYLATVATTITAAGEQGPLPAAVDPAPPSARQQPPKPHSHHHIHTGFLLLKDMTDSRSVTCANH